MKILVTGATGTVGSPLVTRLLQEGVDVRALTRSPTKADLPAGVEAVEGDLLDVDALRGAMRGVDSMFLLSAVIPEELAATLTALNVAREAALKGVVYLSVYKAEEFTDVPHQNAKHAAERMIEQRGLPTTVLRPAYYMQNDLRLKDAIVGAGLYPSPIGSSGVSAVDIGDIVEVAARELLRRAAAPEPLPREIYDLVGPEALTGADVAAIWSDVLGKPVAYAGDLDRTAAMLREHGPAWFALDILQMYRRFSEDGAAASAGGLERLAGRLGRAPRSYRDFASATATAWQKQ